MVNISGESEVICSGQWLERLNPSVLGSALEVGKYKTEPPPKGVSEAASSSLVASMIKAALAFAVLS
jgi:hypothetical protein